MRQIRLLIGLGVESERMTGNRGWMIGNTFTMDGNKGRTIWRKMGSQRGSPRQPLVGDLLPKHPSPYKPIGACRCPLTTSEAGTVLAVMAVLAKSIGCALRWTHGAPLLSGTWHHWCHHQKRTVWAQISFEQPRDQSLKIK